MAECYRCGRLVPRGHGYRREVYTGHSNRLLFRQAHLWFNWKPVWSEDALRHLCSELGPEET